MPNERAHNLVSLLRGGRLRSRTGILLLNARQLGHEGDVAARLQVAPVDFAAAWVAALPPDTRQAGIDEVRVYERLDAVAQSGEGGRDCVAVYNFDLVLARLSAEERERLWRDLFIEFPNRRASLLLAMPETADFLLPGGADRAGWERENRIAPGTDPEPAGGED